MIMEKNLLLSWSPHKQQKKKIQKSLLDFLNEISNLKERIKNLNYDHGSLKTDYSNFKANSKDEIEQLSNQTSELKKTFVAFKDHHNNFASAHNKLAEMMTGMNKDIDELFRLVESPARQMKDLNGSKLNLKGRHR